MHLELIMLQRINLAMAIEDDGYINEKLYIICVIYASISNGIQCNVKK
jgi:hypothetical protein